MAAMLMAIVTLNGCSSAPPAPPESSVAVNVSGTRIQLDIQNPHANGPTVVLLSGHGAMGIGWVNVRAALPNDVRSVWIDRAGVGWSEPARSAETPQQQVSRLRDALQQAGLPGPYVIVGHSLGGAYAMLYAKRYPQDVAALALVSPTTPGLWSRLTPSTASDIRCWMNASSMMPALATIGVLNVWNPANEMLRDLPVREKRWGRAFARSVQHLRTTAEESQLTLPEGELLKAIDGWSPPKSVPVSLLIETDPPGEINDAREAEAKHLERLADGKLNVIRLFGAQHVNMITRPRYAEVIAEVIAQMVRQSR
jgi:pimeloyl-ACP methyl ester carboxylesterase